MFSPTIHNHVHIDMGAFLKKLDNIAYLLEMVMATQAELAQQLNDLKVQVTKIGTEIDGLQSAVNTLQTLVVDLQTQIANSTVTPELQAAFDAVKAQVQVVDDKVPDLPPPTP